jgi:hypothetical protein
MKSIPLTQGYAALVDDEDYERLNVHKWHASVWTSSTGKKKIYAERKRWLKGKTLAIHMHREVLGANCPLDHKDGDGLNNQKYNLRRATGTQNNANRLKGPGTSSPYKGVSLHKGTGKWEACIKLTGKKKFIGLFKDAADAATAYNFEAEQAWGDFARMNVPLTEPACLG